MLWSVSDRVRVQEVSMVRGLAGALVSVVVVGLVSACGGHGLAAGREGDIEFAQQMIPHHQQAVEMAEVALSKEPRAAIVELAREIRREQDPEILLMRTWLDEWGAQEAPHAGAEEEAHAHEMPGMATGDQMLALAEAEGGEFERQWLDLMIAHHEGAIEMAEQVRETTEDPEVRALAEAIIDSQQEEIDQMQGLFDR
jgi:uncharacterized protein (DUF305 family)